MKQTVAIFTKSRILGSAANKIRFCERRERESCDTSTFRIIYNFNHFAGDGTKMRQVRFGLNWRHALKMRQNFSLFLSKMIFIEKNGTFYVFKVRKQDAVNQVI